MFHRYDHAYGVVTWPRHGRLDQTIALWRRLTWSPSKSRKRRTVRDGSWIGKDGSL